MSDSWLHHYGAHIKHTIRMQAVHRHLGANKVAAMGEGACKAFLHALAGLRDLCPDFRPAPALEHPPGRPRAHWQPWRWQRPPTPPAAPRHSPPAHPWPSLRPPVPTSHMADARPHHSDAKQMAETSGFRYVALSRTCTPGTISTLTLIDIA